MSTSQYKGVSTTMPQIPAPMNTYLANFMTVLRCHRCLTAGRCRIFSQVNVLQQRINAGRTAGCEGGGKSVSAEHGAGITLRPIADVLNHLDDDSCAGAFADRGARAQEPGGAGGVALEHGASRQRNERVDERVFVVEFAN